MTSTVDEIDSQLYCLIEEWKQNVALYIDQDKRQWDRIRMFLIIHAGLLILYGAILSADIKLLFSIICLFLSIIGIWSVLITRNMSKRAHAFILLRIAQGILVEKQIKRMINENGPWKTSSGIITTFTREHVAFVFDDHELWKTSHYKQWKPLKDEIKYELGCHGYFPFTKDWPGEIKGIMEWITKGPSGYETHFGWLRKMFALLLVLWMVLLWIAFGYLVWYLLEKKIPSLITRLL